MSEASLQTDHLVINILSGIVNLVLGIILLIYIRNPDNAFLSDRIRCLYCCRINNRVSLIALTGWFLITIGFVCFVLWMVDLGQGINTTKLHYVLSVMVVPLGITMAYADQKYEQFKKTKKIIRNNVNETAETQVESDIGYGYGKRVLEEAAGRTLLNIELHPVASLWRDFLPIYCFINCIGWYDHHHISNIMPQGEADSYIILFWLYLGAGLLFGTSRFLAILYEQTVLFIFGSLVMFVIGIWFIYSGIVLYGGFYGVNGANYADAVGDFEIIVLIFSTMCIILYRYKALKTLLPLPRRVDKDEES